MHAGDVRHSIITAINLCRPGRGSGKEPFYLCKAEACMHLFTALFFSVMMLNHIYLMFFFFMCPPSEQAEAPCGLVKLLLLRVLILRVGLPS